MKSIDTRPDNQAMVVPPEDTYQTPVDTYKAKELEEQVMPDRTPEDGEILENEDDARDSLEDFNNEVLEDQEEDDHFGENEIETTIRNEPPVIPPEPQVAEPLQILDGKLPFSLEESD